MIFLDWRRRHRRFRIKLFRHLAATGELLLWLRKPERRTDNIEVLAVLLANELTALTREYQAHDERALCDASEFIWLALSAFNRVGPKPRARGRVRGVRAAQGSSVYFVQQFRPDGRGDIKIGRTASLKRRVADLNIGSSAHLSILGTVPGDEATERRLHERFAADRLRGEWFRASDELLGFILNEATPPKLPVHEEFVGVEPRQPLTALQAKVLTILRETIKATGVPPKIRALAKSIGVASTFAVTDHLNALERKGWIEQMSTGARYRKLLVNLSAPIMERSQ